MIIVSADVTDKNIVPFIIADHIVTNANGSISFALDAQGSAFAGQEPNQYGVRHDSDANIGVYQMFTRNGALVSVLTRPGDTMFVYSIAEGQSY